VTHVLGLLRGDADVREVLRPLGRSVLCHQQDVCDAVRADLQGLVPHDTPPRHQQVTERVKVLCAPAVYGLHIVERAVVH